MVQTRIGVAALFLLSGALGAAAQEIVLTNGSRLAGTVERYENGFAYIKLFKESGRTVLTTMPESSIDKVATQQAQASSSAADESSHAPREGGTGPFKLPHNDLSRTRPGIADLASEEKERRAQVTSSGAATGRVFRNGERATGIPSDGQVEALADLREQPIAHPEMDAAARVAGMRFYEARLETLTSAFVQLESEWEEMWSHCTPITYVGASRISESSSGASRPHESFRAAVVNAFRNAETAARMEDKWSIACVRRDSDFIARGKRVVEVYDVVFDAYADFATNTGQDTRAVARALPASTR